jgi:hypothetical protein
VIAALTAVGEPPVSAPCDAVALKEREVCDGPYSKTVDVDCPLGLTMALRVAVCEPTLVEARLLTTGSAIVVNDPTLLVTLPPPPVAISR